ncbi:MAG: PhoH-like ATPase [Candidatus Woesearchaeota archaeon]|nr:PhoH-like ATPase [Candidatus Woesearchaeota archaeon]
MPKTYKFLTFRKIMEDLPKNNGSPNKNKRPSSNSPLEDIIKETIQRLHSKISSRKIVILDTNVLISDPTVLYNFKNSLKVIPYGTIGAELNNVSNNSRNAISRFNATEAKKTIENIIDVAIKSDIDPANNPIPINDGNDFIYLIDDNKLKRDPLKITTNLGNGDLSILNTAKVFDRISKKEGYDTILITNDLALRTLAKINNLNAEELKKGSIDLNKISKGYYLCSDPDALAKIFDINESYVSKMKSSKPPKIIPLESFNNLVVEGIPIEELPHNSYIIFTGSEEKSKEIVNRSDSNFHKLFDELPHIVFRTDRVNGIIKSIKYDEPYKSIFGICPKNLEQYLFMNDCIDEDIKIAVGHGVEGTGKTLISLASSIYLAQRYLKDNNLESNPKLDLKDFIKISKPIVHSEEIGYLPGGVDSKLELDYFSFTSAIKRLWDRRILANKDHRQIKTTNFDFDYNSNSDITSIYDSYDDLMNDSGALFLKAPLGFMRGVDWGNGVWIIDEFQNAEIGQARSLITRAGDDVKIIITGCPYQIDSKYLRDNYNALAFLLYNIQKTNTTEDRYKNAPFVNSINLSKTERGKLAKWGATLDVNDYDYNKK